MLPVYDARVTRTFNATVAGHRASPEMAAVLRHDWLPALALALQQGGIDGPLWQQARKVLQRLGWLLQRLPAATAAEIDALANVVRQFRRTFYEAAPALFPDATRRAVVLQVTDAELRAALGGTAARARSPLVAVTPAPAAPVRPVERPLYSVDDIIAAERQHAVQPQDPWQVQFEQRKSRVASLRPGDRLSMLTGAGVETWRVVRSEPARDNILLVSEDRGRQGALGLSTLVTRLEEGSLTILA